MSHGPISAVFLSSSVTSGIQPALLPVSEEVHSPEDPVTA